MICGTLGAATTTELLEDLSSKTAELCVPVSPADCAALATFLAGLHARAVPRESPTCPAPRLYVVNPCRRPSCAAELSDLSSNRWTLIHQMTTLLAEYLAGHPVDFSDVPVDLSRCSPFTRRVLEACRSIPYGETRSYKQLAECVGEPRASRAVGQALARNPVPLIIPCHRVISTSGKLCGFTARGGTAIKARLLAWEARHRRDTQDLRP
ncbi:Methylated-DNA--protein-cysteine methyltransferase [Thermogutta terrifontis]|uniref:methylated-DNA--[protein]-cysteine S-methyltransferase n=2 Tax=Thermogutta terrifontis TaxID=1331910 RepID=A0A286RKU1_9BACT|nr:Methylated-DNA--protein-cysteine methyltransferase [Thermogutta terrifontis]